MKLKLLTLTDKKPAKGSLNSIKVLAIKNSIEELEGTKIIEYSSFVSNSEQIKNAYNGTHENGFAILSSYYNSSAKNVLTKAEEGQGYTQKSLWKIHQNPVLNEFADLRNHSVSQKYLDLLGSKIMDESIESKFRRYRLVLLFVPTTRKLQIIEKYLDQEILIEEGSLK